MIGISLQGGLGNQLSQYAAARAASERLDCPLAIVPWRLTRRTALGLLGSRRVAGELAVYHPNVVQSHAGAALAAIRGLFGERVYTKLFGRLFPHHFKAPRITEGGVEHIEAYDPAYAAIQRGTWLYGYFQGPKYLKGYEEAVKDWYAPSPSVQAEVDRLAATFPAPPEDMVAVHVRRTDYLKERGSCADPETGWALPLDYYRKALEGLPSGLRYAFFSDDPEFVADNFGHLDPWICAGVSAGVDLHLMGVCRHMVIANSSFSWWAAYLNKAAEKVIVAPKFHIGWREKVWYPAGIDVDGWTYIEI